MAQFVCLSGLPRSGSTILSAILDQNPLIHAEGNSAVCQLMWDMQRSGTVNAAEQLKGNNREHTVHDILRAIPRIYYKDIAPTKKIVVDKCRAWTIGSNADLLRRYIDPAIKIIVLERSVTAIMKSFLKLYQKNNWKPDYINAVLNALLKPNGDPIMSSIIGINMAKKKEAKETNPANRTFLFIQYDDLQNIINTHPENDEFYKLEGFHAIRPTLQKAENNVVLPPDVEAKCRQIDTLMGYI